MSNGYDRQMYQELYTIRSRMEYLNEIYQENYAMRTSLQNIESLLDKIYKEIADLRQDMARLGPSRASDIKSGSAPKRRRNDDYF